MKMRPWHRRALAGVMVVAIYLSAASDEGRQAEHKLARASELPHTVAPQRLKPSQPPQPLLRVELERLSRPETKAAADTVVGNAFGAISWYVPPPPPPPPPPPKPVPPPPPTAPPMPFSYFGRYEEDGTLIILLVKAERIYTVSEGEVIENTYRVERLTGGLLELTYLPLNIKQTIGTGET
jgi:hypothetical protein